MGYYVEVICRASFPVEYEKEVLKKLKPIISKIRCFDFVDGELVGLELKANDIYEAFYHLGYNLKKEEGRFYIIDCLIDRLNNNWEYAFKLLSQFLTGFLEFRGEDGQWWQWRFVKGNFQEKHLGRLFNDDEEEIAEAHNAGIFIKLAEKLKKSTRDFIKSNPDAQRLIKLGTRKLDF